MIEDTERQLELSSYFPEDLSHLHLHQSVGEAHVSTLERVNSLALRSTRSRYSANGDYNSQYCADHAERLPSTKEEDRESEQSNGKLGFKQRIRHMTWAYFTLTMATGGIANVLHHSRFVFRTSSTSIMQSSHLMDQQFRHLIDLTVWILSASSFSC